MFPPPLGDPGNLLESGGRSLKILLGKGRSWKLDLSHLVRASTSLNSWVKFSFFLLYLSLEVPQMETVGFKPKDLFFLVSFVLNGKILNYQTLFQIKFVNELEELISCTVVSTSLFLPTTHQHKAGKVIACPIAYPKADMDVISRAALWLHQQWL